MDALSFFFLLSHLMKKVKWRTTEYRAHREGQKCKSPFSKNSMSTERRKEKEG